MSVETGNSRTGWLRRNVANMLTLTRLFLLPVIVWTYGLEAPGPAWTTPAIVLIAALSDTADGVTARRLHTTSRCGPARGSPGEGGKHADHVSPGAPPAA